MFANDNVEVWGGFEHAIRGMRNPLNSWDRSDSYEEGADAFENCGDCRIGEFVIGEKDLALMKQLCKAGTEHRKFLRQIFVRDLGIDDFSHEWLGDAQSKVMLDTIHAINTLRREYVDTGNKVCWRMMIQMLPESYNQKRTITMSYENVLSIIHQRRNHKLFEWREFCRVLSNLPYVKALIES